MHILPMLLFAAAALIPFETGGKWGYRDVRGKVVLAARYEIAQAFSPAGMAAVVDEAGWAYIDTAGRVLIRPLVVDNGPDDFAEELARFRREGKVGFFDRRGKVVIEPRYSFALPFSEGLAAVCEGCTEQPDGEHTKLAGGRWGFIDRRGTLVIPARFDEAAAFEHGRARVRVEGRAGRIDRTGRLRD